MSILSGLWGSDLVRSGLGLTEGLGLVEGLWPILCSTSRVKTEPFLGPLLNSSDEEWGLLSCDLRLISMCLPKVWLLRVISGVMVFMGLPAKGEDPEGLRGTVEEW